MTGGGPAGRPLAGQGPVRDGGPRPGAPPARGLGLVGELSLLGGAGAVVGRLDRPRSGALRLQLTRDVRLGRPGYVFIVAPSGPEGRVTNAVGTIFRKIFVGTRARPI